MRSEFPEGAQLFELEGDNIIVRQSWWNHVSLIAAIFLSFLGTVYVSTRYPEWAYPSAEVFSGWSLPLPILGIIPLALIGKLVFQTMNVKLVLAPEYILFITGIMAWRRRSIRLDYSKIQEIEIDESLPQRIYGIGDIIVTPIATGIESTIRMPGVGHPRALKDLLRVLQHSGGMASSVPAPPSNAERAFED